MDFKVWFINFSYYKTMLLSRIDIFIIKSNNSSKLIPFDLAEIGKRLVEDSPGRVFTSRK